MTSTLSTVKNSRLNELDYEDFVHLFGNVIEHGVFCAAAVWKEDGYNTIDDLHEGFCTFIDLLPHLGKIGLLRLYPDLAGKLTELGCLTHESNKEHAAAGLDTLTLEEKIFLKEKNARYKDKFSFPFVVCARLNKKEAIFKGITERLGNSFEVELNTGIEEVKKICYLRLTSILN